MNSFVGQQNGLAGSEELRRAAAARPAAGRRDAVICPKPRRAARPAAEPARSTRLHHSTAMEQMDSTVSSEILGIILTTDGTGSLEDQPAYPVHLFRSPPIRSENPLIHDPNFIELMYKPTSTLPLPVLEVPNNIHLNIKSPSPSGRAYACNNADFGPNPPLIRVEGFDCLSQDRRGHGVSAFA